MALSADSLIGRSATDISGEESLSMDGFSAAPTYSGDPARVAASRHRRTLFRVLIFKFPDSIQVSQFSWCTWTQPGHRFAKTGRPHTANAGLCALYRLFGKTGFQRKSSKTAVATDRTARKRTDLQTRIVWPGYLSSHLSSFPPEYGRLQKTAETRRDLVESSEFRLEECRAGEMPALFRKHANEYRRIDVHW